MIKPHKLEQEIVDLLLDRLRDEYYAFYLYRSASNWCTGVGFIKAGKYFEAESNDELEHAKKIEDFLVSWNVMPDLDKIDKPKTDFKSLLSIIELAYKTEYDLYEEYEDVSNKILKMGDTCVFDFLKFFRKVQLKSITEYSDMLNILEGIDTNDKYQMLMLEENLFGE